MPARDASAPTPRSGDLARVTGTYAASCDCRSVLDVSRCDEFPPCPHCVRPVDWTLLTIPFVVPTPGRMSSRAAPAA
jgi:hypothetical protein